jgi:hypothetical protein
MKRQITTGKDRDGNRLHIGDRVLYLVDEEHGGPYEGVVQEISASGHGITIRLPRGATSISTTDVRKLGPSKARRTATKRKSTSRSKPKRAGAKRRTVGRLRRVGGGVRKGHGVFKHGAAPTKKQRGPEHYLVWLTVPLHKPKIYGRYSSRRAADRVANALQKRADSEWSSNGRCDVSVESPDHQQLRHIIESYEQG